jgi:tRNA(Ile)-lysidine synthase
MKRSGASPLAERVDEAIRSRRLLKRGQKVLVAVSGGLDSMVLLHLLHGLSRANQWSLTVAHLNHQLRGRSSDADERFVVRAARALRLPVVNERAECRELGRVQKWSLEMAARQARHEFLARTATRLGIRTVAVAHHADDQIELFFLRLFRGSGNEGLAGMRWKNPSPVDPAIELVRPLLDQPRAVLREYAGEVGIRFREDATNSSLDIQRNRIRHELLPLLRRNYQPALDRAIRRVMEIAGAEAELAGDLARDWLAAKPAKAFEKLPVALQRRCIQAQLLNRGMAVDFELVEQLRTKPGHFIKVSPDLAVKVEAGGRLDFRTDTAVPGPNLSQCDLDLTGQSGDVIFDGVQILWSFVSGRERGRSGPRPGRELFDAEKVGTRIVLRHWRAGDRFQPSGMRAPVKLQDLFTNNKIPRPERHGLIVATARDGSPFWVERLRISEAFKLSAQTIRCLQWQWKRL